ncbi:MAG: DUF4157 domain-containing protein [Candidatus Thiodiazotropha taylori]|nr:DUF4157 domain-containing protein [Candidatus Thiodiazotropha endolucinida]MCW4228046.1 DUF4157 domain-containing protein [Candidatus Thiodiazotropha taylori]
MHFSMVVVLFLTISFSSQLQAVVPCNNINSSYLTADVGKNNFLLPGQCMWSPSRNVQLVMQHDGNLVLYDPSTNGAHWSTKTNKTPSRLAIQEDGNLVIYYGPAGSFDRYSWNSKTSGSFGPYFLMVQDDGNLVIYRGKPGDYSLPIWSRTAGNLSKSNSNSNFLGQFGTWLEDRTGVRDVTKPIRHFNREYRVEIYGPQLKDWILLSRDDARRAGTNPIPTHIKKQLVTYFPESLLNKVEYRNGQGNELALQSNAFRFGDATAITLGNVIVFKNSYDSWNNVILWAHEIAHVDQYERWGISDFAKRYIRDYSSVEREATNVENDFRRHLMQYSN